MLPAVDPDPSHEGIQKIDRTTVPELKELTTAAPSDAVVDRALARTLLTNEVSRPSLDKMVGSAQKAGFLKDIPALDQLLVKP
mgnify:CR=1 FL=1